MTILLNIFYSFVIIYFILFAVFWSDCRHNAIIMLLKHSRKAIIYLGLWHNWGVFSSPWLSNKKLLLEVEYNDGEKEVIDLFDSETMIFLNRKSDTFDEKYTESLLVLSKSRANFVYYVKNYIEKIENKKIKRIEFIEENKEIKLWNSSAGAGSFFALSSHSL